MTADVEEVSSRRRNWGWIMGLSAAGLFLWLVVGIASQFISKPLQVSAETTYITEPLKPDGKQVDYFLAIEQETYPPNLATEDNGYRLIVERLGFGGEAEPWQFEQICQKLGLDLARLHPDAIFQEPYDWLAAYTKSQQASPSAGHPDPAMEEIGDSEVEDDELSGTVEEEQEAETDSVEDLEARLRLPWTLDDLPMMEPWLQQNGPALDLIDQAVRRPVYHIPLTRRDDRELLVMMLVPELQRTRGFARGLSARANYRIGTGDIDGAIDDIIACKRLGRHVGHGATLVDLLVGIAIEGIADAVGVAGALEHPPSSEQLRRLLDAYDQLPSRAQFAQKLRFERYSGLQTIQALAHGVEAGDVLGFRGLSGGIPAGILRVGVEWNVTARRFNEHFDALVEHGSEPPPPEFRVAMLVSRGARGVLVADLLAGLYLPAMSACDEATYRGRCGENVRRITLAMLLYERDHGTLPPAWTLDGNGERLHSWRVLLLPYLGQTDLFAKVRLDEPWDSEHNRALHDCEVPFYQCPTAAPAAGRSSYAVIVGDTAAFNESGSGRTLDSFGPHSAQLILVIERKWDVCWMDPTGDANYDTARLGINVSARGISSRHPHACNVGLRSGATHVLSQSTDIERVLARLIDGTYDEPL